MNQQLLDVVRGFAFGATKSMDRAIGLTHDEHLMIMRSDLRIHHELVVLGTKMVEVSECEIALRTRRDRG